MVHPRLNANTKTRQPMSKKIIYFFLLIIIICFSINILVVQRTVTVNNQNNVPITNFKDVDKAISSNTQKSNNSKQNLNPVVEKQHIIAYAITVTSCPSEESSSQFKQATSLIDGAAVLAHSIYLSHLQSSYDYHLYAFIHPDARSCAEEALAKVNYTTLIRDVPVPLESYKNQNFKEKVVNNGCCGDLEFIKLWSYSLVDYDAVVHLDIDTLILKPMDHLFDIITKPLDQRQIRLHGEDTIHKYTDMFMWPDTETIPEIANTIQAFFTRDYNMANPAGRKPMGLQGGFLILKPSLEVFEEFRQLIIDGAFVEGRGGWGGKGYGGFYGAMTFQGIIPYYYDVLHPNTAVELNRCVFNTMADNPRDKPTVNNIVSGKCRDGRDDCEDCRERNVDDIYSVHFTLCQKPWQCMGHNQNILQHKLCKVLFREWFRIRADFDIKRKGEAVIKKMDSSNVEIVGDGLYEQSHFRGLCKNAGGSGYIPIDLD